PPMAGARLEQSLRHPRAMCRNGYCAAMSTYRLTSIFEPAGVAVVGGSPRERSAGRAVMRNLREGGYAGRIGWVSPRHRRIDGIDTVPRLAALGWVPDLVVIT